MDAAVIYPHQLFAPTHEPVLARGRYVYLVEEPLLLIHNPAHVQRLLLHRLSLHAYRDELEAAGYTVRYLEINDLSDSAATFTRLAHDGVREVHITDTTDDYLERAIEASARQHGLTVHRYDSPLFLLSKQEAVERYLASKRFMKSFYERLRRDTGYLMQGDQTPYGGQFSFDTENRLKLPNDIVLPSDITWCKPSPDIEQAAIWLESFQSERYGESNMWIPHTRIGAKRFLEDFLHSRFHDFGPYEDALSRQHARLFHSTLSPLLNIGLLSPSEVLDTAIEFAGDHTIPLNSLEGFMRQILGWREFIRASYEVDGSKMRTSNFWSHHNPLPKGMWCGQTGLWPVDHAVTTAVRYGYTHHIERLMILGNYMLLTETSPHEVYRWFMGMYVDAYDWVMVPNVYGMSQFADGGIFATKPYISGANYLRKMSNYPQGEWETTWTALYWSFIHKHKSFFENNPRLSMMPRLFDKMDRAVQMNHLTTAQKHLRMCHQ